MILLYKLTDCQALPFFFLKFGNACLSHLLDRLPFKRSNGRCRTKACRVKRFVNKCAQSRQLLTSSN